MKWTKLFSVLMLAISTTFFAASCKQKPTDAELKANVETAVANNNVMVDVQDGAVTLTGNVTDETAKSSAESSAKTVDGVKTVTNNLGVTPPPPPVVIADDAALVTGVNEAVKNYKGVTASVNDGVVTLTGTIKRTELTALMQTLQALQPKKVENNLTIN
jgi:osmotically-inducible protein OsmY